jgi:hypothetical protein
VDNWGEESGMDGDGIIECGEKVRRGYAQHRVRCGDRDKQRLELHNHTQSVRIWQVLEMREYRYCTEGART